MFERKLYLTGLGGNRYEVSMEELKKEAFTGKIKKTDIVIVVESSDGNLTSEKQFRCDNIKGVAELFDQGERAREAMKAQGERAREAMKAREEQEKVDKAHEKEIARQEHLKEQEWRFQLKKEKKARDTKNRRALLKQEDRRQGRTALKKVRKVIDYIVSLISFLLFLFLLSTNLDRLGNTGVEKTVAVVLFLLFTILVGFCLYKILMVPVYLTQYHAETIKKAILVAAGQDSYDDDEFDDN